MHLETRQNNDCSAKQFATWLKRILMFHCQSTKLNGKESTCFLIYAQTKNCVLLLADQRLVVVTTLIILERSCTRNN